MSQAGVDIAYSKDNLVFFRGRAGRRELAAARPHDLPLFKNPGSTFELGRTSHRPEEAGLRPEEQPAKSFLCKLLCFTRHPGRDITLELCSLPGKFDLVRRLATDEAEAHRLLQRMPAAMLNG